MPHLPSSRVLDLAGCKVTDEEEKQSASKLIKLAIELNDTELFQNVAKESVSIGSRMLDCEGLTPVLYALKLGQLEIAEILILEGASVAEAGDGSHFKGWTPFHDAALQGRIQILRALFGKAPRAIVRCCQPVHPIILAIANGHAECVQLIIDHARKGTTTSTF